MKKAPRVVLPHEQTPLLISNEGNSILLVTCLFGEYFRKLDSKGLS